MLIFLDTETTGVDEDCRLVQLAYKSDVKIDGADIMVDEIYKPAIPITIGAMSIHHITHKDVKDLKTFDASGHKEWVQQTLDTSTLVAHKAPFDIRVLRNEGIEVKEFVDTIQVSKHVLPDMEAYTLQYLRYYFEFYDLDLKPHNALDDVKLLEKVFLQLALLVQEKYETEGKDETVKKMIELSQLPIIYKKLSFGKYAGVDLDELMDLNGGYLRWLYKMESKKPEDMQDPNIIATTKHYLKIS